MSFGQGNGPEPPKEMRLCVNAGCQTLTWAGDHYEGRRDGQTALYARFWITNWSTEHVEFNGKTAKAADGVYPAEGFFTGRISPAGNSLIDGLDEWRIGYSASGKMAFTLTWNSHQPGISKESPDISAYEAPRRSTAHPSITIPPGAADEFASFPDYMRAVLQPEPPLTPTQSKLPCNTNEFVTPVVALEIGKFAYRRADFPKGYCWLKRSAAAGNVRASVLVGASSLLGWGVAKDEGAAFKIFQANDGKSDIWNAWFLEKCYNEGLGTQVNKQLAARIDVYLTMRTAGQDQFWSIGADDTEVEKARERNRLMLDPPTKSSTHCRAAAATEAGAVNGRICHTDSVTDDAELQRRLKAIDEKQ